MSVILALLHAPRVVRPLNERAITRTQMRRRRLVERYKNADLLFSDGIVRPVLVVKVGRFLNPLLPFPFDWVTLTGEREVRLVLGQPRSCSIAEVRELVLDYLKSENRPDEWIEEGESWETLLSRVESALTISDLFNALHLDSENAGLDVMS